jgi:hypothetical protein
VGAIALAILIIGGQAAYAFARRHIIISGGTSVTPGPDGTLYMLGSGLITPTPAAYLTTVPVGQSFLKRFDPVSGRAHRVTRRESAFRWEPTARSIWSARPKLRIFP